MGEFVRDGEGSLDGDVSRVPAKSQDGWYPSHSTGGREVSKGDNAYVGFVRERLEERKQSNIHGVYG